MWVSVIVFPRRRYSSDLKHETRGLESPSSENSDGTMTHIISRVILTIISKRATLVYLHIGISCRFDKPQVFAAQLRVCSVPRP